MAEMHELPLALRLFLKAYPWRRLEPTPWTPLRKPLSASRLALISSAGFVLPHQTPFDESLRGGDFSFREVPCDVDVRQLANFHRSEAFDHQGLLEDPNLAFPAERVRELAARGRIGSVNHRHLSFMGSITAPGRLIKQTAPEAVRHLVTDAVDVALLVPV